MNPVRCIFGAIANGIDLAIKTACPMDHTGVRREQARAQAVLDAADALNATEAEVDHLEPFRSPYVEPGDLISVAMPDGTIRTEYYRPASGMRSACGPYVQPEYFATSNCPGGCDCSCCYGYPDRDCHCFADPCNCGGNRAQHGQKPLPDSSRAVGMQHAPTSGEVSSDVPPDAKPSPGDLTDVELLAELASVLEVSARYATPRVPGLITEAKARAARPNVSHEDLAAALVTTRWGGQHIGFGWADRIAADLLADFHITPKDTAS